MHALRPQESLTRQQTRATRTATRAATPASGPAAAVSCCDCSSHARLSRSPHAHAHHHPSHTPTPSSTDNVHGNNKQTDNKQARQQGPCLATGPAAAGSAALAAAPLARAAAAGRCRGRRRQLDAARAERAADEAGLLQYLEHQLLKRLRHRHVELGARLHVDAAVGARKVVPRRLADLAFRLLWGRSAERSSAELSEAEWTPGRSAVEPRAQLAASRPRRTRTPAACRGCRRRPQQLLVCRLLAVCVVCVPGRLTRSTLLATTILTASSMLE